MKLSVLMSVYKSENPQYLDRSLQSIWTDQTLKPNQIVLIEDGPLGKELNKIIDKWKLHLSEKLYIVRNNENIGLTKSLNRGLKVVTGQFIARMDSDDIAHPLRFERQIKFLSTHPDVAVVGGSIQEFNDSCECLNIRHYPSDNIAVLRYIHKASPLAHPAVMMRKSIFDAGLSYNEQYRTSQDIALWFDVLCRGFKIANINDIVLYFRRDDEVFKRRSKKKAINEFKIYISGIHRLYGLFSWRYIYPVMRFAFRMMPQSIIKKIYGGRIRKKLLENNNQ